MKYTEQEIDAILKDLCTRFSPWCRFAAYRMLKDGMTQEEVEYIFSHQRSTGFFEGGLMDRFIKWLGKTRVAKK